MNFDWSYRAIATPQAFFAFGVLLPAPSVAVITARLSRNEKKEAPSIALIGYMRDGLNRNYCDRRPPAAMQFADETTAAVAAWMSLAMRLTRGFSPCREARVRPSSIADASSQTRLTPAALRNLRKIHF